MGAVTPARVQARRLLGDHGWCPESVCCESFCLLTCLWEVYSLKQGGWTDPVTVPAAPLASCPRLSASSTHGATGSLPHARAPSTVCTLLLQRNKTRKMDYDCLCVCRRETSKLNVAGCENVALVMVIKFFFFGS